MSGRICLAAAITVIVSALFVAPGFAGGQADRSQKGESAESPAEIGTLIRRLQEHAAAQGATIEDIGISTSAQARGEDAAQAAQMAVGGADAALIPLSLARTAALRRAGWYVRIADSMYTPIEHAAVATSDGGEFARELLQFLVSATASEILSRHGYIAR